MNKNYKVDNKEKLSVNQWYHLLNDRVQKAPKEAARFYNLQLLPRLMHQLEKHSDDCEICREKLNKLDYDTKHIVSWFKDEGIELKDFQNNVESSMKHLQEKHKVVPKGLWLSKIIVIGFIIGLALGYLSRFVVPSTDHKGLIILGIMLGVFIGWIYGKLYEKKLRKEGNIF